MAKQRRSCPRLAATTNTVIPNNQQIQTNLIHAEASALHKSNFKKTKTHMNQLQQWMDDQVQVQVLPQIDNS